MNVTLVHTLLKNTFLHYWQVGGAPFDFQGEVGVGYFFFFFQKFLFRHWISWSGWIFFSLLSSAAKFVVVVFVLSFLLMLLLLLFCFFFVFCFLFFCLFVCLFCFVLFCFVLFCFVLFCFVLFCFVLICFVLFCFVLFCFVFFTPQVRKVFFFFF